MPLKVKRPLAFIDIEATGLNVSTDRIIEIAVLKLLPDSSKETKIFRVNPLIPIPIEVSLIHGIYDTDVADLPTFKDIATELFNYLDKCDLAGYNSNRFDIPILVEEFLRADIHFDLNTKKLIDVYKIFTLMEKRDLSSAYKFYCNKELINAHQAEADINATYEVLEAQLIKYIELNNNVDYLHEISKDGNFVDLGRRMVYDNGIPVFNFGKYKGIKVSDVFQKEPQYFDWILKNDFALETKQKLKEIMLQLKLNTTQKLP